MITEFDNNDPDVTLTMNNITIDIFEHLDINSWKGIDTRVRYTEVILKGLTREIRICNPPLKQVSGVR